MLNHPCREFHQIPQLLQQLLCVGLLVDSCQSERLLDSKSSHTLASQHPGLTLSYCDDILFECVDKCREFKWILRTVPGNTRSFAPTNWSAECAPQPSSSSFLSMTTSCRRLYVMFITAFMASFLSVLTRLGHYPSISSHASCSKAVSKRRATSLLGPCTRCAKSKGCSWPKPTTCCHVFPQGKVRNCYLMFVMLHTPSTVVILTSGLVTSRTTSTRVAAWVRWVLLSATLNWENPGKHVRNLKVSCLSGLDFNVAICMTDEAAMLISPLCHLVLSYEFRCCICLSKEALVFAWLCWNASLLMWNMDKRSLINSNLF